MYGKSKKMYRHRWWFWRNSSCPASKKKRLLVHHWSLRAFGWSGPVYLKNGYRHDAGPTVITAPNLFDELFALFGRERKNEIEFIPLKLWYRFRYTNGETFDYHSTTTELHQAIAAIEPEDVIGYQKLLKTSKTIYQTGFEQLINQPFLLSSLLRYRTNNAQTKKWQSVWQLVNKHLKSKQLRQAFSIQPLLVGGNPFDTTSIYNLIHFLEHKDEFILQRRDWRTRRCTWKTRQSRHHDFTEWNRHTNSYKYCTTNHKCPNRPTQPTMRRCNRNTDPAHLYQQLLLKIALHWAQKLKIVLQKSMGLFVLFFGF